MTQPINPNKITDFARLFHYQYSEETLLPEICGITLYQKKFSETYGTIGNRESLTRENQGHSALKYNQIGKRSTTPVEILNSEQPLDIIQSYVRSLRLGERQYILNQLDAKAENDDIETILFNEATHVNFQEWCSQVRKPDHLFLPLDTDFYSTVFDWRRRNEYDLDIGEVAISGNNVVKIHWVPLDSGIEHGYLLSSEGLDIVQKWFDDSPAPSEFSYDTQYDTLSDNRPLMIYIGDEILEDEKEDTQGFEKKVDFLYRIVISELMLDSNHAIRLQPTKSLSND
jgi:hypothetical protein